MAMTQQKINFGALAKKMSIELVKQDGEWVLKDEALGPMAYTAILNTFRDKDKLEKVKRCPVCNRKAVFQPMVYRPTRHMVEVLFEMHRVIMHDPKQRGYVRMTEEASYLRDEDRIIGMTSGTKQIHKMIYLGLATFVDKEGKHTTKNDPERRSSCYAITVKGMDLLAGKVISPFQIRISNSKPVFQDEDRNTSGTITDVKALTEEDWKEMARESGVTILEVPKVDE